MSTDDARPAPPTPADFAKRLMRNDPNTPSPDPTPEEDAGTGDDGYEKTTDEDEQRFDAG